METERIAALLHPFFPLALKQSELAAISHYLDLLLRWNARVNLTSVRDADNIVTRHIGESLFTAHFLLPRDDTSQVIDLGSGAGFPGIPLKIYAPAIQLTLIESRQKKAAFLKEAVRALRLDGVKVFSGRAELFTDLGDLVTLRAVERFDSALPVAASLLKNDASRIALMVGASQENMARKELGKFVFSQPVKIPHSMNRILLVGRPGSQYQS